MTIIQLLVENIKHNQLLNGLYEIGFYDNNLYMLKIYFLSAKMFRLKHSKYFTI
jgi:hypothetical protein